jgi:hypothetical protein
MTPLPRPYAVVIFLFVSLFCRQAVAVSPYVEVSYKSYFSSNVYLNENEENDWVNTPALGTGLDFADYWTAGYRGGVQAYLKHPDLLYHEHALFLLANPVFGAGDQHEALAELTLSTQRNTDTYENLNLVEPELFLEISMEPLDWMRWTLSEDVSYRLFYEDTLSSALNSWTRTAVSFIAKSRTTVTPRLAYGVRYFPESDPTVTTKQRDQQLEAGIHLSQGLADGVGLRIDYAYLHAFDASVLTLRKMSSIEFDYIGEAFLYTGHKAQLGLKALFDNGVSFDVSAAYTRKRFGGWPVLDEAGEATDQERKDHALKPNAWLRYTYWPKEAASAAVPEVSVGPFYSYLRQWSNDPWYDCDRHEAGVTLELMW